jgi:hypothetical protein
MDEVKEWFKITRAAKGGVVVTCTRQEGTYTAKYAAVADSTEKGVAAGVKKARDGARDMLGYLTKAVEGLS